MNNDGVTVVPVDAWYSRADDLVYGICPECETSVTEEMTKCPGCGAELNWEGEEE